MSKFYDDGICRYILIEANQVPGKDSAAADKDTPTEKTAEIPSDGAALTDDTAPSDQSNDGAATGDNAAVCKEDYYAVYKCPRQMTEIAIPEAINGIPVKAISPNTFNCKSIITAIKLPRQLVSIGDYAFNSCTSLEKIVIPSKVEKIGIMAFSSCAELKSIVVPPSVISIGEQAFENSDALKIIYVQKDSFAHKWFTEKLPQATGKLEFYNSDGSDREFSSPVYDFNYALTKDGVYIEKYTGSDEAVRVPATFSGTRVVGIGSDFLRGCTTVKSVFFLRRSTILIQMRFPGVRRLKISLLTLRIPHTLPRTACFSVPTAQGLSVVQKERDAVYILFRKESGSLPSVHFTAASLFPE